MTRFLSAYIVLITIFSLLAPYCHAKSISSKPKKEHVENIQKKTKNFSLDVKNMDIVEVLKIISQEGGFNLFISANVRGRVTFFLKGIDVWDAFEILLLSNNLAYEKKDDAVYVMPAKEYETTYGKQYADQRKLKVFTPNFAQAKQLKEMISQIMSSIGKVVVEDATNMLVVMDIPERLEIIEALIEKADKPIETEVIKLNFADAVDVAEKLTDYITQDIGKIQVDETANKVIVSDYRKKLVQIKDLIAKLDEKPLQVLITAKIIEIQPSKNFYAGVNWDYWLQKYFRLQGDFIIPSPSGTVDKLRMGSIGTSDVAAKGDYTGILEFLETFGNTKILSSPRIVALHNEEAKILVGTKDVYITSTVSEVGESAVSSQSVNFVDVGVKLFVTPKINQNGYVTLKIKPEISSSQREIIKTDDKETEIPIVTTSEAETSVVVKDGVSIIIGGLQKDTVIKESKRVPVLGAIPGLNYLLGGKKDTWSKNELVILLTPRIISGDKEFEVEINERKSITDKHSEISIVYDGKNIDDKIDLESNKSEYTEEEFVTGQEDAQSSEESDLLSSFNVLAAIDPVVENRILTDEFVKTLSYGYNHKVVSKIYKAIELLPNKESGTAKVRFILARTGHLIGEPVVSTESENDSLKEQAQKAIKLAKPFPEFPSKSEEDSKIFEIELNF